MLRIDKDEKKKVWVLRDLETGDVLDVDPDWDLIKQKWKHEKEKKRGLND